MKQIKISDKKGKNTLPLSKEQKRFNNYVSKIKKLKNDIEEMKDFNNFLMQKGQELIVPIDKEAQDVHVKMMLGLENAAFRDKLHANSRKKLRKILQAFAETAVFSFGRKEYQPLFDKYSKESFEERQERETSEQKEAIKNVFGMIGVDIEDKDMETPEDFARKLHETQEKMAEKVVKEAEAKAERDAKRKKTKAQIEKAEREKQAADALNKTTKQIYRDLVQNFHPDREQDEVKRQEKTEIMQQITAAYEADDFLKLLELQINLLDDRENAFGKFDDNQMKYFNNVLKSQVEELEYEAQSLNPKYNGHPFGHVAPYILNKEFAVHSMLEYVAEEKKDIQRAENTFEKIQTLEGLKEYVKNYKFESDELDISKLLAMMSFGFR
jgi:hypothetical protein